MRLQKRFCIRLIVSNVVRAFLQIEYMVLNIYTSVYKHINCVFYRSVTVCLTSSLTTLNSIALFHKIYPIGKLRLIHTICPATFFLTAHISSLSLSLSLSLSFSVSISKHLSLSFVEAWLDIRMNMLLSFCSSLSLWLLIFSLSLSLSDAFSAAYCSRQLQKTQLQSLM